MKYGHYKLVNGKLVIDETPDKEIVANVNGEEIKVKPDDPLYNTVRSYGKYKEL